jgi:excisionase family DNA binding protein
MPLDFDGLKLYSIQELSDKLHVSTVTLRKYIHEGRLKGQKIAGKWLVTGENMQEFLSGSPEREKVKQG